MHFVRKLNSSSFFIQNKNKSVALAGKVNGPIDHLIGDNMNIAVGNDLALEANFSMRNITRKGGEFFHFGMKNLETNMDFLKSFILNISEGWIIWLSKNYSGQVQGY